MQLKQFNIKRTKEKIGIPHLDSTGLFEMQDRKNTGMGKT
jgi:hypothetical protein